MQVVWWEEMGTEDLLLFLHLYLLALWVDVANILLRRLEMFEVSLAIEIAGQICMLFATVVREILPRDPRPDLGHNFHLVITLMLRRTLDVDYIL